MKKRTKIIIAIIFFAILLFLSKGKVNAAEYIWPIGGRNANETYKDYDYYGSYWTAPYKNGKSGREYIVDNEKWPEEKYFYAKSESHYGMDITGKYNETYKVVSVCNGTVIGTSADGVHYGIYNGSIAYEDRNQRNNYCKDGGGYGNYIIIEEETGESTKKCFLYAHLKANTISVKKGDKVTQGQEIATMGSSGNSGHMHLHFEIRKSKAVTIGQFDRTHHYLQSTRDNSSTYDPEEFIGSKPNVHIPVEDIKLVKISQKDAELYVRYLYRTILGKTIFRKNEDVIFASEYIKRGSLYEMTKVIFLNNKTNYAELENEEFVKKVYEVFFPTQKDYDEQEILNYIDNLNRGIWNKEDFLTMIINCEQFANKSISEIIELQQYKEDTINIASENELCRLGDLDNDGRISVIDASLCLGLYSRFSTSKKAYERYSYAVKYADVDGDGKVTSADASWMMRYYAEASTSFNIKSFAEYMGRTDMK